MRISKREYLMALALERRTLELLGNKAPAWALEDAGQLGPNVQVVDDDEIQDVTEPVFDEDQMTSAARRENSTTSDPRWRARLAATLEDTLRAEGFAPSSAHAGAADASRLAAHDEPRERTTEVARTQARQYERRRQRQNVQEAAERVRSALVDLGLTEGEASESTVAAIDNASADAGFSQLLTVALRDAERRGNVFAVPVRTTSNDTESELSATPVRVVVHGEMIEIAPDANPQLAAALLAIAERISAATEEPGDQDDRPAPPALS